MALAACAEAPAEHKPDPEQLGKARQALTVDESSSADVVHSLNHKRSAPEIVLRWEEESTDRKTSSLTIAVESHSTETQDVALTALVASPVGDKADLELGTVSVEPGQSRSVRFAGQELPVQTRGAASSLRVSAEWTSAVPGSTDPDDLEAAVRTTIAETRHVTWTAKGRSAEVRSARAQENASRAAFARGEAPRLTGLRLKNKRTGKWKEVAAEELSTKVMGGMGSDDAPIDELLAKGARRTSATTNDGRPTREEQ